MVYNFFENVKHYPEDLIVFRISDEQIERLRGVQTLIVNALRWEPHLSHFTVDEAIALSRRIAPRRTLLTHCSHQFGLYSEVAPRLPEGIEPAYDMLRVDFNK